MNIRHEQQIVQEGEFLAKVDVDLIVTEDEWSPYLSDDDARKLDDVRRALKRNDIASASRRACVYRLTPINAA